MIRTEEIRERAFKELQQNQVLMLDGHFDFGNGYHGPVYVNPHQLYKQPSTIAQSFRPAPSPPDVTQSSSE